MAQIQRTLATSKLLEVLNHEKKSKNIEISIFNWTLQYMKDNIIVSKIPTKKNKTVYNNTLDWKNTRFVKVYLRKCRSILFNLQNPENPRLLERVLSSEIKSKDLAYLSAEEMFPDLWIPVFKKLNEKEMRSLKNEGLLLENAVETNYQCNKCKCRKVDHYSVQTRSADEPMTIYFTCMNCSNRWKE